MARENPKWVICCRFVVREEESVLRDLQRNWNLISMQISWKLEPLVEFESTSTDSIPPHEHLQTEDKICLDMSGKQSSVSLQYDMQACNVLVSDIADNTFSPMLLILHTILIVSIPLYVQCPLQ